MEALIIIDVQNGLVNKNIYNKDIFIDNVNNAIIKNRNIGNLIIFIQHNSKTLKKGTDDWKICTKLKQNERDIIIQKKHGDAFDDTILKKLLNENEVKSIIICGLVSNGCVFHSCKNGLKNGFIVKLLSNGHTNWLKNADEKIKETNAELNKLGIELL